MGVVTEELKDGKHGKTSVLELIGERKYDQIHRISHVSNHETSGTYLRKLTLLALSGIKGGLASIEVSEETIVVNGTDGEEHLGPAKSGDGINGSNTMGDGCEGDSWGNVSRESEDFRNDVSDDGQLGNTSVLGNLRELTH